MMSSPNRAKLQVAFSKKSVVLRTPMIWLEEENPEAKPPPFEFWIKDQIRFLEKLIINTKK